jgi:hypothetical protein
LIILLKKKREPNTDSSKAKRDEATYLLYAISSTISLAFTRFALLLIRPNRIDFSIEL